MGAAQPGYSRQRNPPLVISHFSFRRRRRHRLLWATAGTRREEDGATVATPVDGFVSLVDSCPGSLLLPTADCSY